MITGGYDMFFGSSVAVATGNIPVVADSLPDCQPSKSRIADTPIPTITSALRLPSETAHILNHDNLKGDLDWLTRPADITSDRIHGAYSGLFSTYLDTGACSPVSLLEVVVRPDISVGRILGSIVRAAEGALLRWKHGLSVSHVIVEWTAEFSDVLLGEAVGRSVLELPPGDSNVNRVVGHASWRFLDVQASL